MGLMILAILGGGLLATVLIRVFGMPGGYQANSVYN